MRTAPDAELYGAASAAALYDETYENYRRYLNPPLARVMKVSGSPVEVRAEGSTITDHNGKSYLDFAGGYGVFTLGHRHPRVVAAVKEQLDRIALSGRTMFNPLMGRLAKRLAELTPGDLTIAFFANTGTEAVEGALKLARAATKRPAIVSTHGAFHGKTLGALSASGRDAFRDPFMPLLADVRHVPFGDALALRAAVDAAVAAVIVEPIQGEGGVNIPPGGYLRDVRAICDAAGAVMIADEVQTGLGRCGVMFACDRDGVVPDVMTLGEGPLRRRDPDRCLRCAPGGLARGVRKAAVAAYVDVRRERAGLRRRAGRARRVGRRRTRRERRRARDAVARRACARRRRRFRRSSPTRAAPGCWSASSCAAKATAGRSFPSCSSAALPPHGRSTSNA